MQRPGGRTGSRVSGIAAIRTWRTGAPAQAQQRGLRGVKEGRSASEAFGRGTKTSKRTCPDDKAAATAEWTGSMGRKRSGRGTGDDARGNG